jgi:hypothetical protein
VLARARTGPGPAHTLEGMTPELNFDVGYTFDVVVYAVGMAVLATLLWLAYQSMQHPRLPLIRRPDDPPLATWAGVSRYLLTTPFVVGYWMLVLMTLLAAAARDRSGTQIVIATTAVIGGTRLLAHLKQEIAHELAKAVPIAILGYVIIGGGLTGFEPFVRSFDGIPLTLVDTYWVGLMIWDVFLTAAWFGWVQMNWRRRASRVAAGGHTDNLVVRVFRRLRAIGYTAPGAGITGPEG